MMYPHPFFPSPFFPPMYRKSRLPNPLPNGKQMPTSVDVSPHSSTGQPKNANATSSTKPQNTTTYENTSRSSEDSPVFELFGISLYFDDLLLLVLLFFLYSEDVQDQELFFALILLLLT